MISVFDLEKLRGILKDFYEISHIRITVFDENRNELVSYPTAVAPYCAVIRGSMVLEIKDTTYNYDTTTAPEFTDDMVQEQLRQREADQNVGPGEELDPEE